MRQILILVASALAAATSSVVVEHGAQRAADAVSFPGWPSTFDGRPVVALPLSTREAAFARDFPGRVGRFSDGRREIIVRWAVSATRRLHPAADCFRGLGYETTPLPLMRTIDAQHMGCFRAVKAGETFRVCEVVREDGHEASTMSWPDVPAWYWAALTGATQGPWWNIVVAERIAGDAAGGEVRSGVRP
ncbi:MAG: hypothetical protein NW216_06840 [Hyphomicrobium sp.]|nr:hypothetical protein [Hyphomicrobium sp.]